MLGRVTHSNLAALILQLRVPLIFLAGLLGLAMGFVLGWTTVGVVLVRAGRGGHADLGIVFTAALGGALACGAIAARAAAVWCRIKPVARRARSGEAGALSDLAMRSKASWGYSQELMTLFRTELTLSPLELDDVYVIDVASLRGGFYSLQTVSSERAELGHLFVEPALHRRGIGRLLIADALHRCEERGVRCLTIQGDPNARPFYEALGATCVGERASESIAGRLLPLFEMKTNSFRSTS